MRLILAVAIFFSFWIMETATKEKRNGMQWTMLIQLDDLDFAEELAPRIVTVSKPMQYNTIQHN